MYPFLLILVTFICIELHARNFRPLVLLWKPFHKVVTRLRRSWDPRASIINAFSTFLLLTFSKSILITTTTSAATYLVAIDITPETRRYISFLYADPRIRMYSKQHLPYFLCSTVLLVTFFAVPTLLLCLFPTKIFRKLLSSCLSLRLQQAVSAFIDTFQGHYKDGTNATRDYRAASSIHLLIIFQILCICIGRNRRSSVVNYAQPGLVAVSLFYSLVRPCKQNHANIIQSLLYALTALIMYIIYSAKSHNHYFISIYLLRWRVSKLIFARAKDDHFQCG